MFIKNLTLPSVKKNLLGLAVIIVLGLLSSCDNNDKDRDGNRNDKDRDGNRTSLSYSEDEFDNNLTLARKNCTQSDAEAKKQCLISYLGCSAVTGDVTCDD